MNLVKNICFENVFYCTSVFGFLILASLPGSKLGVNGQLVQDEWNSIIYNPIETDIMKENHVFPKIGAFKLVAFEWDYVRTALMIAVWVVVASCAKLLFHANEKFANNVPGSACLILAGLLVGLFLWVINVDITDSTLSAETFFLYLLPPIIFCGSYVMPMRLLFDNIDSIFLFSFFGTIFNAFTIGYTLIYFSHLGYFTFDIINVEALLFGSLISAVDPIAVIAIFEQVHVNDFIFINVFGEALFNDGVSLVLYLMFLKFHNIGEPNIHAAEYFGGAISIVVIGIGGVLIGIIFGFLASYITKYTSKLEILAPGFIFFFSYIAYITAVMLEWSAVLATVSCGMVLKQYVTGSLSYEASTSVKYAAKFLSDCSETVVFVFLGLSTVYVEHGFDLVFIIITVLSCLVFRTIGIILQCGLLNIFRARKFFFRDQFILSYGGLRGAIAYGLAVSLPTSVAAKNIFVTTTIANIDFKMAGIEAIVGHCGHNFIREKFERINSRWLKPIFTLNYAKKSFDDLQLRRAFGKAAIHDAILSADRSFMTPQPFASPNSTKLDIPDWENVIHKVWDKRFSRLTKIQELTYLSQKEKSKHFINLPDSQPANVQKPISISVHDFDPIFIPATRLIPWERNIPKVQYSSSTFIN